MPSRSAGVADEQRRLAQARFEADVALGICVICGAPAEAGTRYCGGENGCPVNPANIMTGPRPHA